MNFKRDWPAYLLAAVFGLVLGRAPEEIASSSADRVVDNATSTSPTTVLPSAPLTYFFCRNGTYMMSRSHIAWPVQTFAGVPVPCPLT